jgi:hypothetical protein
MKTIRFNTGRKYTAFGQRIVATLHDDGIVTFHDIDRMITGDIGVLDVDLFNPRSIMNAYDANHYTSSTRAWKDGMMRGAVNSQWDVKVKP